MTEVPIMVMPWHKPDPCKPPKMQVDAAFKSSYLDYLGTLNLESPPLPTTLSGIMCTIGSSSKNLETLTGLMISGMTMALIPLAVGQRQDHIDMITNIRTANTALNQTKKVILPLAIAVQTKGPGLRIGGLYKDNPVQLTKNQKITLSTDKSWRLRGTEHFLYVNFPEMGHVLTEGDVLLIGNGVVILQVEIIEKTEAVCKVVEGGVMTSFMSLYVPDVPLHLPPLSEEDKDDLKLVASMGVDIVVASHTQSFDHLREVRKVLSEEENGSGIKIWAHIESKQALNNLESIIKEADAVILSRVGLTNDMPPEKLFLAQKKAISACQKVGIPVYLTSHYLPSMQVDITPPVTELFDVANAVLDGADGFALRNTTAIGQHPEHTVRTLVKLCREAEAAVWQHQTFDYLTKNLPPPIDPTHAVAISAVEASLKSSAAAIILATTSGRSAQLLARYRPRCPIIAITRYGQVARQLQTWRAVIPLHYVDPPLPEWNREVDVRIQFGIEYGKECGIIVPGDVLVLVNGWRQGAGFTNTLRLVYASDSFPWVYPHRMPSADKMFVIDSDFRQPRETFKSSLGDISITQRVAMGDTDERLSVLGESESILKQSIVSDPGSITKRAAPIDAKDSRRSHEGSLVSKPSGRLANNLPKADSIELKKDSIKPRAASVQEPKMNSKVPEETASIMKPSDSRPMLKKVISFKEGDEEIEINQKQTIDELHSNRSLDKSKSLKSIERNTVNKDEQ